MKKKYRVLSSRFDIPEHEVAKFEADDANSDAEAGQKFDKEFKSNKNYGWNWLRLERIDQEENTTQIAQKG